VKIENITTEDLTITLKRDSNESYAMASFEFILSFGPFGGDFSSL
jgi:hypothetical protein